MPKAASTPTTPKPGPLPFDLIDLDAHPDGALLRLCAEMTKLQERWDQPRGDLQPGLPARYWATAEAIAAIQPKTLDGLQMKALIALDMLKPGQRDLDKICTRGFTMWGGAVSIVKDVIRGVPA